jgi:two-component system alkaline phosphatase synthesis response regulator PhoP
VFCPSDLVRMAGSRCGGGSLDLRFALLRLGSTNEPVRRAESRVAILNRVAQAEPMKTILIVEDEYAIAETLRELLEQEGFQVATAANGEDALTTLSTVRPNLILMDIMMPVLDGIETLRRIRANDRLHAIPIILMSAAPKVTIAAIDERQFSAFLKKPFDIQTLLEKVGQLTRS